MSVPSIDFAGQSCFVIVKQGFPDQRYEVAKRKSELFCLFELVSPYLC